MQTVPPIVMEPMMLLSAMLDQKRNIVLKFYDPKTGTMSLCKDTSYDEYCYADPGYHKIEEIDASRQKSVSKVDPVTDKELKLRQIFARGWAFARHDAETGEHDVSGNPVLQSKRSDQVWESDIKPYESYLHDNNLTVGMYYDVSGKPKKIDMPVPDNVMAELQTILESKESGEFKQYLDEWARTLSQPIPHIRRTAIDIEIESERGQSIEAVINGGANTITAISFKGDGIDRVLALGDPGKPKPRCDGFELVLYEDEVSMLRDAFKTMGEYPVILTYNGANFDLPYLKARATFLESAGKGSLDVPFNVHKITGAGQATHSITFRKSIHVDLYNIMDSSGHCYPLTLT